MASKNPPIPAHHLVILAAVAATVAGPGAVLRSVKQSPDRANGASVRSAPHAHKRHRKR
ncbi:MAG: hypothetical protein JSS51_14660 [Planctomycetes bacterium]|nr:hypothetical protein [Planctomycetota bacterium]